VETAYNDEDGVEREGANHSISLTADLLRRAPLQSFAASSGSAELAQAAARTESLSRVPLFLAH